MSTLWNMRFKLHHELVIAPSPWCKYDPCSCTKSHKFRFKLSNCYNKIIDFRVIYDDMNNIFMEHSVDINYECNLKCSFVHTFFLLLALSLRSRYTTMRNYIYVKEFYICYPAEPSWRGFTAEFMFCECFYAKRILLPFAKIKWEKEWQRKKVSSRIVFEWIILKNMYLILYHKQGKFMLQNMNVKLNNKTVWALCKLKLLNYQQTSGKTFSNKFSSRFNFQRRSSKKSLCSFNSPSPTSEYINFNEPPNGRAINSAKSPRSMTHKVKFFHLFFGVLLLRRLFFTLIQIMASY